MKSDIGFDIRYNIRVLRLAERHPSDSFVCGDVGMIPACGALEVLRWTFGSRTQADFFDNKSARQPLFLYDIGYNIVYLISDAISWDKHCS
jgi:hypothetical protein